MLELDWRGIQWDEDKSSGNQVNRLIGEFLGERQYL